VVARGLEAEAQMRLPHGIQAKTSYTLQRAEDTSTGQVLPNSPRHTGVVQISGPTRLRASTLALNVVIVGPRDTLHGDRLGTAATADTTFNMPLTDTLALTAGAYNLFNASYADPASDAHRQDVIPQDGRTLRVGVRMKLGR